MTLAVPASLKSITTYVWRPGNVPGTMVRSEVAAISPPAPGAGLGYKLFCCAWRGTTQENALPARRPVRVVIYAAKARELPMLKFYFNGAPNPNKVALFLEESGLPYELVPVDTRKGYQFKPEFLAVNPNGKVPAIDDDGVFVFDSNAILLYLAEKTGKFLPANTPQNRAQLLSWLMFIATGLAPYSGQAVHFKHAAPKDLEYAHNRYQSEAHRHYKILEDHLAKSKYMVGDTYTIVDMAFWGGARMAPSVLGDDVFTKYPNVKRLLDEVSARPAASRAIALKDKFVFKAEMDEEARHIT